MRRSSLLVLLALSACRPPAPHVASRQLDALWFRDEGGERKFGTTRIRATVVPSVERQVRVGVLEEYVGATGVQWRTSVWLASFLAAEMLERELTENQYVISAGGFIDGPSAG